LEIPIACIGFIYLTGFIMADKYLVEPGAPSYISITPLLKRLWPAPGDNNVTAEEIALAISHIFTDQLSPVQTGALLTCLHFTGWDRRADVLAKCAEAMRAAASIIDRKELETVIKERGRPEGEYQGGLVCSLVPQPLSLKP
jgi:anthranilate phosphoribosyltransferase